MAPFISWLKTNKTHAFIISTGLLLVGSFWLWDDTPDQLAIFHQAQTSQAQILKQWQQYQEARHVNSPQLSFFEQYQKAPRWTRAKIKQAIDLLAEAYSVDLREFLILESGQNYQDWESGKKHRLRLTMRASRDHNLFAFIQHLSNTMRPWIKISQITLQRCGDIDESVVKEVRNGHHIDIVEARFELEWILNLDENDHTADH